MKLRTYYSHLKCTYYFFLKLSSIPLFPGQKSFLLETHSVTHTWGKNEYTFLHKCLMCTDMIRNGEVEMKKKTKYLTKNSKYSNGAEVGEHEQITWFNWWLPICISESTYLFNDLILFKDRCRARFFFKTFYRIKTKHQFWKSFSCIPLAKCMRMSVRSFSQAKIWNPTSSRRWNVMIYVVFDNSLEQITFGMTGYKW